MKKYELLLVLPGTLDEKEAEVKGQEILALVQENSTAAELHPLGKNRLAYPIRQIRYGYFNTIIFTADPLGLKVLQDKLVLLREPLRAMITYFNMSLTAAQKIIYSSDDSGATMTRDKEKVAPVVNMTEKVNDMLETEVEKPAAPTTSPVERKINDLNIDEINKKLEDIMKGDVLPM